MAFVCILLFRPTLLTPYHQVLSRLACLFPSTSNYHVGNVCRVFGTRLFHPRSFKLVLVFHRLTIVFVAYAVWVLTPYI